MHSIVRFVRANLQLSIAVLIGLLLIVLRYTIKNSQLLTSKITSASRLFIGDENKASEEAAPALLESTIENNPEQSEATSALEQQEIAEETEILQPLAESNVQEGKSLSEASEPVIEGYCVKCRQKRNMLNPEPTTTKNGRRAMEGTCPICGTRLFRFI